VPGQRLAFSSFSFIFLIHYSLIVSKAVSKVK